MTFHKNSAVDRLFRNGFVLVASYFIIVFSVKFAVHRLHPEGLKLFALATLPALPIIGFLMAVANYLNRERDEYKRNMMVRCLLWGIGATLSLIVFAGFLGEFGWKGTLPPFTGYIVFWISAVAAAIFYLWSDRVKADE
jgi:hypothetical protein